MRKSGALQADLLTRQIASITEKTFQRLTIWLHNQASIQNTIGYIHLRDVDSGQNDFHTCEYGIDCVCSNLICTDYFGERR
jgi:hypothetical protein